MVINLQLVAKTCISIGLLGFCCAAYAQQSNNQYFQEQQQRQQQAFNAEQARQGYMNSQQSVQKPEGEWKKTWGAIALDTTTGDAGTVIGRDNRRAAVGEALKQCSERGGKSCKLLLAYQNQCAATAMGSNSTTTISGLTIQEAETSALNGCGERSADCKVVYSDCSKPEFVRY